MAFVSAIASMIARGGKVSNHYLIVSTFLALLLLVGGAHADVDQQLDESKSWWQQRHERSDIYYPHKAHFEVMKEGGDPCLMCHSFAKNGVTEPQQLKAITTISNEPLEAICHDCHMVKQSAPTSCDLCHTDMAAIWPADHDFDYSHNHAEAARRDRGECQSCHIDLSLCTDCHFRRDRSRRREHLPGYRSSHGLDARLSAISCSRCHNVSYCSNCHRGGR